MRIREGDPLLITLTPFEKFRIAVEKLTSRLGKQQKGVNGNERNTI